MLVGDRVMIVKKDSQFNGYVGFIREVEYNERLNKNLACVEIEGWMGRRFWFDFNYLDNFEQLVASLTVIKRDYDIG